MSFEGEYDVVREELIFETTNKKMPKLTISVIGET